MLKYLVIGSGLAGLYTAHRASALGSVLVVTKRALRDSNSFNAQGGIAAVTDIEDNPDIHFTDTVIAGRGLCEDKAVRVLVQEGPQRIKEIIGEGMKFDTENGKLSLGLEGGHHRKRILHAGGDSTGRYITEFLISKVQNDPNITIRENVSVIDFLVRDGVCYGARCWDEERNCEELIYAEHTFLTTGGTSAIYTRTFLISEAVRGEGAWLIDKAGKRFMLPVHELAELAPRDIVARSIFKQMALDDRPYVVLSLKHLDPEKIRSRFPNILAKCAEYGYDLTDWIPVAPAAHYTVGGVASDLYGRTDIRRLYVCGEIASTGIMGANRLASNSLIECLVFAHRAIGVAEECGPVGDHPHFDLLYRKDESAAERYYALKRQIAHTMNNCSGIIRSELLLSTGLNLVKKELRELGDVKYEYYDEASRKLLTVAYLIMTGARFRRESRGGHYREDYPMLSEEYALHTVQKAGEKLTTKKVNQE